MPARIRADDVPPVPWRNGGGVTRHLLADADADGDDWRWRISLADVDADGPFSAYPGVQRWFAVVAGRGVELRFRARTCVLRDVDEPLAFDGAEAPGCRLLDGPTRDLNLMVRDGARGVMRRGRSFDEQWPWRARFDVATLTLEIGLDVGPLRSDAPALWIGIAAV